MSSDQKNTREGNAPSLPVNTGEATTVSFTSGNNAFSPGKSAFSSENTDSAPAVGVASAAEDDARSPETDEVLLPALARRAVETFVRERRVIDAPTDAPETSLLRQRAACFVSLKTASKELRGCIGTIEPSLPGLAEELVANAISAATRDPRFPPVTEAELSRLRYSVDVLFAPEETRFEDLDPSNYGVIVEDETGARRGLLLPAIEGVETAGEQVEIAARKAGIPHGAPLRLYRFRVRRFREGA